MGNDIGAQQNYQRSVLDAINTVVQRRIDGLKLDKTVVGIIDKNIGMLAGYPLYQVKYEGGVFTATARDASESYARNTAVYVMIPQSDFSKEKFIIGRASSIATTSAESASISAAINNYVRLGPNLIPNKSIYGLHSYHDPKEEIDNPNSYQHRFNFLYEVNGEGSTDVNVLQNLFKTYAADATNILLRADFRTNLDVVQQRSASGRYGLAVTLTFTNPNAGYGETQGEILDNLGGTIVGKAQRITTADESYIVDVHTNEAKENNNNKNEQGWVGNFDLDNISLKDWDKQLQLFFNSKDVDKSKIKIWQKDGVGLFDCYTQYIQTIYQTFCINNAALQSSMTDNLVAAYLNLLSDLKNATNIENPNEDVTIADIKRIYNDWKATSIGDLSDVDEIIYLTSDSMLGDPFTYTQWNNQYVIPSQRYDFSCFKEVKSIVFFKDGFKEDSEQEQLWPPSDAPKNGGEGWDIFCRNIQLFLLKDLDSEYQGFSLKVECAEGYDGVLKTLSSNEKTAFNAHVYRNQIEELTSNANIQYIWLKQNSQVINAKHADYYHYAGVGWKRLKNTNRFFFQTTGNENWAYKNLYKCIALYQTSTEIIPLSTTFTVYNDAVSTKVKLESDLGTAFTFSEGAPTITCLIEEAPLPGKAGEEAENYQEYGYNEENSLYKYQWSIADSNNSSVIFLTEAFTNDTANVFKDNLISKIKMWYWDRENQKLKETRNPTKATRIQYPVSLSSSGFTVECIVQKNFSISDMSTNTSNYYDVGNDSIEISNLKMASSSSYRIVIENGDQVFQYDEYGNAPTVTKLKDPLVIKPLRAKILGPTGLEFSGENANIEWIFNLDDTMIVPTEKLVLNPATQQEQLLKGDTCTFDITKLYNPNAQNNQITCHANFNNIDVYTDTKFYFGKVGSNGTNGTDMVSKISYDGNDNYFVLNSQPLTLYVQKDVPIANSTSGEIATQAMFNVPDSENDNNLKTTQVITSEQVLNVHLYQKGEEVEETNFSTGYPRWNLAGNANGTINNTGKHFEFDQGNKITWRFAENNDKKHLFLQNIKSEVKLKNSDQIYYSFFSLPVIEYEDNSVLIDKMLPMQRIAIEKATYLNDVVYNADGRNPIFNHNQGLKLINLPKGSVIYWTARGGLNAIKSEHSNIVQEYFETEPCFSIGFEKNTKDTYSKLISKREKEVDIIYELEKEKYKNENKNLYENYKEYYEKQKATTLTKFKEERLRILQEEVINNFIENNVRNNNGNNIYTEEEIRNGQDESLPLNKCQWFFENIDKWWDSEAKWWDSKTDTDITYYYKIQEKDPNTGEIIRERYEPLSSILIWDETRYQTTDIENAQNECLYSLNSNNEYEEVLNTEKKDYLYKTIYCRIAPCLTEKQYFDLIYPSYYNKNDNGENTSLNIDERMIQILEEDANEAMIYILPNDIYDGSATNNRVEAKIYIPNENVITGWNLYATVYAPINMTLNTFGLDSINAWDGNSVTIDDERGAILAPQVGAGEKDANNRFTGILMGKTNTYTGQSDGENQTGLFGYSYGLQSIFLDAKTGNADFGLPNGTSIQLDSEGNYIGLKNDNYNEGRIELRPGGISKIGGWRLGRRGLYYAVDSEGNLTDIGQGHQIDYIPNVETGEFEKKDNTDSNNKSPYSSHHEKDIPYNNSGILLHSGVNPYISIKGHQFTKNEIATADIEYIRPEDSLELQLDPKAPTLFTIFRHNGSQWKDKSLVNGQIESTTRYETGSRTFLAGINGKGEFVANTVSSILVNNKKDVYTTQFSVNSFRAFNDLSVPNSNSGENEPKEIEFPEHTGLRIKLGPHILGQMFINNNGFDADEDNENHDPTLYITGGRTSENGEYARPLSLHGKHINLFAQGSTSDQKLLPVTDSELSLDTNSFKINLGSSTYNNSKPYTTLKLFRDIDELNNLMTTGDFKLNAGLENNKNLSSEELFIYYYDGGNIKSIDKRNNPSIYIPYIEKGQTFYFKDNSWSKDFSYYRVDKENSVDYISEENYPTCYKCVDKINEDKIYYYLEDDFKWNYYKVNNLPFEVNSSEYSYLSEDYVKNHRYTKENNTYNLVTAETSYDIGQQYVAIPVELRADDLNQNYVYILKDNVDVEKLYGTVNINNADKYVYSVSRKEYYKLSNTEYIESDTLEIKEQLKDSNNDYYDLSNVDLDLIYYRRKNTNTYFLKTEFDILWVEEDHIEILPEQDDDSEESDESNDVDYRIYNDTNIEDQQLSLDKIYFQYNDEYIPLSEVEYNILSNTETISLSNVEFIEYVLINSTPPKYLDKKVANFQRVYQINNINKILSEEEYRQIINSNNLYYQVKDINDTSYYIFKNLFATINFNYYHLLNNSLINNSNYILQRDLNLTRFYIYDTEDKIYKENNEGDFYQTYIVDLKDAYKYIPIKTSDNSTSDPYVNINNKYFSNSLYLTSELSVWFLKNNFNINTEKKYYYYFDNQGKLVVKELEDLAIYYAVWTTENTLRYVSKDYLDEYDGEKYIYLNGDFKKIATNPDLNKDISISFSTKNYELYAGKYTSRITTNETSNRYASLEIDGSENLSGINFHNSTGPISMYTNSIFDFKTAFGGHISFRNDRQTTFNEEAILGKFVIIGEEYEKGLNLTENWLRLKNEKIQMEGPTQINLFSEKRGNGAVYDITNPQIVLRAGSSSAIVPGATKATDGAAVELILNSSNNGWATVIERTNLEDRMSHPVFAIRTTYSGIGIYPEIFTDNQGTRLYSELFYVKMPQYNSMGLTVQGEIPGKFGIGLDVLKDALFGGDLTTKGFFRGNGTHITNTCNGGGAWPSGSNEETGLGTSISLKIPYINVNQQGRPSFGTTNISFKYKKPTASEISYGNTTVAAALSDLAGKIAELKNSNYATQKWVKDHFAPKSHAHLLWYTKTQITDKDGNRHSVVSGIDRRAGTYLVYISN